MNWITEAPLEEWRGCVPPREACDSEGVPLVFHTVPCVLPPPAESVPPGAVDQEWCVIEYGLYICHMCTKGGWQ